jgi:hypothetical protein
MVTDAISELPNAQDEEFGLERLEQLLTQHSAEPLPEIWERIMERVRQYSTPCNRMIRHCFSSEFFTSVGPGRRMEVCTSAHHIHI